MRWRIPLPRLVLLLLAVAALARFGAAARGGLTMVGGDFYQTLPGPYVEKVNPGLWNSPDLEGSAAFHKDYYLYGPIQYLTLYPIAYLHSYGEIAKVLLVLYAVLIAAIIVVLWRTMVAREPGRRVGVLPALCAVLFFAPLIQCYVQREFEVVTFLIWAIGAFFLVAERETLGGAAVGYVTWFKLLPIGFLPYFALRRSRRAVIGFVAASVVVLTVAQLTFGLNNFLMFSMSRTIKDNRVGEQSTSQHIVGAQFKPLIGAPATFYLDPRKSSGYIGTGVCDDWN